MWIWPFRLVTRPVVAGVSAAVFFLILAERLLGRKRNLLVVVVWLLDWVSLLGAGGSPVGSEPSSVAPTSSVASPHPFTRLSNLSSSKSVSVTPVSLDDFLEFGPSFLLLRASSSFRDFSDQSGGSSMPCGRREDSMQLKNWRRWPPAGNCKGWCWVPSTLTRTTVHSRSPPPWW